MVSDLKEVLTRYKSLPKFKDGRIDYSNSDSAPVLTVFVKFRGNLLLLKRSSKVNSYKGLWNTVAGYLDEFKPLEEKILEELREEIGLKKEDLLSIKVGLAYEFHDQKNNMTWIVFPALAVLKHKPEIRLDWEHTEYRWIKPEELEKFECVPSLKKSLDYALTS
jgi:isopentenyldiphosphate isomerase